MGFMKIEGSGDSLDGALRFKDVGICHSVEEGTLADSEGTDRDDGGFVRYHTIGRVIFGFTISIKLITKISNIN